MKKRVFSLIMCAAICGVSCACSVKTTQSDLTSIEPISSFSENESVSSQIIDNEPRIVSSQIIESQPEIVSSQIIESEPEIVSEQSTSYESEQQVISSEPESEPVETIPHDSKIIVIDAGHQLYANYDTEPVGPGTSEMKMKVTGGTSGVASGMPEYQLTLTLALKLQAILEERGYVVIQTRTSHDVDISNAERAEIANSLNADAFIRIHANGVDDSEKSGAMTLCQTPNNPYNGWLYYESKALSENVLDELAASTGCVKEYVWETDTMSGINWAQVPVTIVEVGYMSNPQEDLLMTQDDYQNKISIGIANGIDIFFQRK